MSTLKVNAIRGTGASSDAISVNATDGTCTAKITNNLSNRNLIINGAMNVAQRGTSDTSSSAFLIDRWKHSHGGANEAPTYSQHALTSSDTGPWEKGFRYSFHIQNGNQTSGAEANDYIQCETRLEAQDLAQSGWDYTSTSSYVTLSFWVKSSVAQAFPFTLQTSDGTAHRYTFTTGSLSANTWTKVTKTIPGNSSLTFDNDNGVGLYMMFWPYMGTTWTGTVTENAWFGVSGNDYCNDITSTWWTTNDSTFEITGVQLEVGDVATDFEHRSYADELARCQRYYEVLYMSAGTACCYSTGDATIKYAHTWYFKQEKRAQASVALLGNAAFSVSGGSSITLTGIFTSKDHVMFYYDSGMFRLGDGNQDASVKAESEL